ncbi:DUF1659 domain-containing protein [Desulfofalx alkaliphila]|uniref:DUF1659 domain-containing protein n=1 Tax=Desulfofalx alkaliphila TaxID=105483 RepID=UPI0004E14FB7|nr:DUF1659 domain-containing protein [Desulfofalx alkaliphila]
MAVIRNITDSTLRLKLQTGTDHQGNPVFVNRSYRNIKMDAEDQKVYEVAELLAGLQTFTLNAIERIDANQLIEQ